MKLTRKQKEILDMIQNERLTIKEIAQRRQTTRTNIYKIVRKLKKKGINFSAQKRFTNQGGYSQRQPGGDNVLKRFGFRLHSEQIKIDFIPGPAVPPRAGTRYVRGGARVHYWKGYLELFLDSDLSFYGRSLEECFRKAEDFWSAYVSRLESETGLVLIKERRYNFVYVKGHVSRMQSGIAKHYLVKREALKIRAREDGKLAYLVDNSFNLLEFEAVHPLTHKRDMERADKQLSDWRDHDPPTNSELSRASFEALKASQAGFEGLGVLTTNVRTIAVAVEALYKVFTPKEQEQRMEEEGDVPFYVG